MTLLFERTSAQYTAQIVDPTGAGVPAATLTSLSLTLYDKNTSTILNGRQAQNVLNINNVTVDASGNLVWSIQPADNIIVTDALSIETHIALFEVVWPNGACRHEVSIPVKNLVRVS